MFTELLIFTFFEFLLQTTNYIVDILVSFLLGFLLLTK